MIRTRLRASLAALAAAGAVVAVAGPERPVLGAEPQRIGQGRQAAPPRDAVPRTPQTPSTRLVLSGERAQRFADAAVRQLDYLPGEVVVRFRAFTGAAGQQRALNVLRGQPDVSDLEWHGPVAIVRDPTQPNAHILAQQLMTQPEVAYAEPNYIMRIEPRLEDRVQRAAPAAAEPLPPSGQPNDEDYIGLQWNFTMLNMPSAWDVQPGASADIIVAVVDTGITTTTQTMTFRIWTGSAFENVPMAFAANPDLSPSRLVDPRDFIFLDPQGPVLDLEGHGTHVSGTIGEDTNNGTFLAGMAYNTRIMPVKVCIGYWEVLIGLAAANQAGFPPSSAGGCSIVDAADGIRYAADRGAKVINLSFGGPSPSQTVIQDALHYAVARGAFVAISMGNEYTSGNPVNYPARYAREILGVMAVGAVGKLQARAFYSSTGEHNEIAAPGGDPTVGGGQDQGYVWQSTLFFPDQNPAIRRPRFDRYDSIGYYGTSMAAPHVAGLAALIMAQSPGVSPANVERAIRATARDLGPAGKDDEYGYGLIQPRSVLFGWGLRK